VLVWIKGLESTSDAAFVGGTKRKTVFRLQGRFKRAVGVQDLVTGPEFSRAPKNLPVKWLVESVLIKVGLL
jgi:hypothetical protein